MGTPYSVVFSAFMAQKSDFEIVPLEDYVIEQDNIVILNNALPKFRLSRVNLWDKDDHKQVFFNELSYEEIYIIACLMVEEWCTRMVMNTDTLIQKFGETDFEFKSQANHLKAMVEAYRDVARLRSKTAISNYSRSYQGKIFDYRKIAGKEHIVSQEVSD